MIFFPQDYLDRSAWFVAVRKVYWIVLWFSGWINYLI